MLQNACVTPEARRARRSGCCRSRASCVRSSTSPGRAGSGTSASTAVRRRRSCRWCARCARIPTSTSTSCPSRCTGGARRRRKRSWLPPAAGGGLGAHQPPAQVLPGALQRPQHAHRDRRARLAAQPARRRMRTSAMQGRRVARALRAQYASQRAARIGPDLSHHRTIVTRVLRTHAVRSAVAQEMREKKITRRQAMQPAQKNADEIAANYSHAFVRFMEHLLTRLWNRLYDGVVVEHVETLEKRREGPRDRLRALPPQPHGLPAAVVRDLPAGLRDPAHRGGHQPQPAGDRAASCARAARSSSAAASAAARSTPSCS